MTNNYHHLSYEERICLEDGLNNNKSINKIKVFRHISTILIDILVNIKQSL